MLNYYQILGVSQTATTAEIKAAFKKLAIQYHPDKNPNNKEAEENFKLINEAYQILNDAYKKSIYDQKLFYNEEVTNRTFQKNTQSTTQKKTYTTTFRRRAYKNTGYDPRLQVIIFFGFFSCLLLAWLIYSFIENYAAKNNYNSALKFYKNKQYDLALAKVHEAVLQDDSNLQAYYLKGLLISEYKNDRRGAIYCFDRCIIYGQGETEKTAEKLGTLPDFYFQRGLCHYAKGAFTQAIADFEHTLKFDAKNEKALLLCGDIYLNKYYQLRVAYNYYQRLLILNPKQENALLGRAITLFHASRYTSSIKELDKIVANKPQEGKAYYYLGRNHLLYYKDSITACENFKKASQFGVSQADYYVNTLCKR
jgi:tetratricopeptide (TPR) repeat protein